MGKVRHQVLDHIHRGEWRDLHFAFAIFDRGGAGEAIRAADIH